MLQIKRVLQLLQSGKSHRQIAKEVNISRNTVKDYSLKFIRSKLPNSALLGLDDQELADLLFAPKETPPKDERYNRLAPDVPFYLKELNRTGVTRLLLWKEYCEKDNDPYCYQQFCYHLNTHRKIDSATMHLEHAPGERGEIDFAGKRLSYIDRQTGEVVSCPVFVGVLPYSGYTFVAALRDASNAHLIPALDDCIEAFGGVPLHMVTDNMKQTVKSANRYEPTFTEVIQQWSVHYNTTFLAARVAKPKDKPTVEKAVDLAYKRVYAPLRNQTFHSLEELNDAIKKLVAAHNRTLLQKRDYSRYDLLIKERESLKSLPGRRFELKYSVSAKVQRNYHVTLGQDWHHYSVPFQSIGRKVKIIYDSDVVEIYDGLNRIASHKRNYQKHGYSTMEYHMPEKHASYLQSRGWNEEYFFSKADAVGQNFKTVITRIINSKRFTEQTYNACLGLLRLKDKYGKERLEAASEHALRGSSITYRSISEILSNGKDQQLFLLDPVSLPDHENVRGSTYYS